MVFVSKPEDFSGPFFALCVFMFVEMQPKLPKRWVSGKVFGSVNGVWQRKRTLIERPADDSAGSAEGGQFFDIRDGGYAAGGDNGHRNSVDEDIGSFKIRTGEHTVFGDVGVDYRGYGQHGGLASKFEQGFGMLVIPAACNDVRTFGVKAKRHFAGKTLSHIAEPFEVVNGLSADDDPFDAQIDEGFNILFGSKPAADLDF